MVVKQCYATHILLYFSGRKKERREVGEEEKGKGRRVLCTKGHYFPFFPSLSSLSSPSSLLSFEETCSFPSGNLQFNCSRNYIREADCRRRIGENKGRREGGWKRRRIGRNCSELRKYNWEIGITCRIIRWVFPFLRKGLMIDIFHEACKLYVWWC